MAPVPERSHRAFLRPRAGPVVEREARSASSRRPPGADRVAWLFEVADVVRRLLAGEVVSQDGPHLHLDEAVLPEPRPVQPRVPLLIGGNGARLVRFAAEADVVGLSGLGRTLEDGHRHEVRWAPEQVDERVAAVRRAAGARARPPALEALVQVVEVSDDRESAAERIAAGVPGLSAAQLLGAPFALVGATDELVSQLLAHRERWGFSRYVVRADAMEPLAPVVERLRRRVASPRPRSSGPSARLAP